MTKVVLEIPRYYYPIALMFLATMLATLGVVSYVAYEVSKLHH